MGIRWVPSADKHQIPREDAVYAVGHAVAQAQVQGRPGQVTVVYVGHPHRQTDRYIEVIAALMPPRDLVVFHVMELSDTYRYLVSREGETND